MARGRDGPFREGGAYLTPAGLPDGRSEFDILFVAGEGTLAGVHTPLEHPPPHHHNHLVISRPALGMKTTPPAASAAARIQQQKWARRGIEETGREMQIPFNLKIVGGGLPKRRRFLKRAARYSASRNQILFLRCQYVTRNHQNL